MLTTILSIPVLILKIIGIILLVILGLIFLILLLLMIPIRYSFEMEKPEDRLLKAAGSVTWLAGIIRGNVSFNDNKLLYRARILGFSLLGNDPETLTQKEERARKKKEKAARKEEKAGKKEDEPIIPKESETGEIPPVPEEVMTPVEQETGPAEEKTPEYDPTRTPALKDGEPAEEHTGKEKKRKQGKAEKEKQKKERISLFDRIEAFFGKIEELEDRVCKAKNTIEEYQVSRLAAIAWNTLIRILRHVFPRSITGWIRFGFDDPSFTGYAAAAAAVLYPHYYKDFSLEPDFQDSCFAGECHGKGRIRLGYLLWILITLLLKKEVRKLIRLILK